MKTENRSVKKYLRRVRSLLPGPANMRKTILDQIRREVTLWQRETSQVTEEGILSRFGKPENIAASYIEAMGTALVLQKMRTRKWVISAVAVVLAFIVLTWTAVVTYALIKYERSDLGRLEVVIFDP